MSNLHVNYVHQSFGDYTKGLTAGLKQLVSLQVTCIVSGEEAPGLSDAATEVLRCHRFRYPMSAWTANRLVQSLENSDVLHWQAAGNPWVDAAALRVVDRQPFVVTVHDMVPHPGDRSVLPGTFNAIRRLVKKADQVIVHAESVKKQVVNSGVVSSKIHVLAHGEIGSLYRLDYAQSDSTASDDETILFFGRMQDYKGLDIVIAAMEEVVAHRPSAKLMVAGKGPALDGLFRQANHPQWLSIRRGYVPPHEVGQLFERAAVVVLPYIEASQSGVAALAIGMGRATVASAVGGLVEVVEPDHNGLLVPPGNPRALAKALIRVLGDSTLRSNLETGAMQRSQTDLSWSYIAKRTVEIYERAYAHSSGSARRRKD